MLRQFHTLLTRCLAAYSVKYDAVIVKMLEMVKLLKTTADDVWHTRNAQGTFGKTLHELQEKRLDLRAPQDRVCTSKVLCFV